MNPTYSSLSGYDSTSLALTHTVDSLTPGKIYRFVTRAKNSQGYSEYSNRFEGGISALPSQPDAPSVDRTRSSSTSIYITWNPVTYDSNLSPAADTLGYTLYMATQESGDTFTPVFESLGVSSEVTEYLVEGISQGSTLKFKVSAHNFNGESPHSEISSF